MVEEAFLGFINGNRLCEPAGRVLLAVSGGLDSCVMARLFHRTQIPFAIAHVNFGLRGEESDGDAQFVAELARAYAVPFHQTRFDTAAEAERRGISIQMAARDLRYTWFGAVRSQEAYASVATAHHLTDTLETMLLNLTRGTGLAGLHGIAADQQHPTVGRLIRPLLFASRDELARYAAGQGVVYRDDASNQSDYYARNRIRHQVLPALTHINPGLWQTLPRTIDRLRAAEKLVQRQVQQGWAQVAQPQADGSIRLVGGPLLTLPEGRFQLGEWLRPYGFSADQIDGLWYCLDGPPGQVFSSATHRICHERDGLIIEQLTVLSDYKSVVMDVGCEQVVLAGELPVTLTPMERPDAFVPDPDPAIAWLDADWLTLPLVIRPWQSGDRFRPLGMAGTRLVSDLLNDRKLSRQARERVAVMLAGDQIVWVIGHRIDHRFRVRPETQRLLRCQAGNTPPTPYR